MCAKRALASSAAFWASRGRMNTLGTDSMAAMDSTSLEHLQPLSAQPLTVPPWQLLHGTVLPQRASHREQGIPPMMSRLHLSRGMQCGENAAGGRHQGGHPAPDHPSYTMPMVHDAVQCWHGLQPGGSRLEGCGWGGGGRAWGTCTGEKPPPSWPAGGPGAAPPWSAPPAPPPHPQTCHGTPFSLADAGCCRPNPNAGV